MHGPLATAMAAADSVRATQAMTPLRAIATFLLAALPLFAQDKSPREYRLATGQSFQAKAVAMSDGKVHLKANILGSETDVHRKLADFQPASQIAIESAFVAEGDFEGHLRIARHAADLDQMDLAGVHARFALKASKGKADEAQRTALVHTWATTTLTAKFDRELAAGHVASARHYLDLLAGPLHDVVDAQALQAMDEKLQATAAGKRSKPDSDAPTPLTDAERKHVHAQVDAADKQYRAGLASARKASEAARLYDAAIAKYKSAWKDIEALLKKHEGDATAHAELHDLAGHVMDGARRASLQAATALATQSDYKGAMAHVTALLAYAPDDKEALAMQRTIVEAEASASGDWRWGWRTAGAPGPVPVRMKK